MGEMADYYREQMFYCECDNCGELMIECMCDNENPNQSRKDKNMGEKMDIEKKKVLTPEFRVSFPAVFQPKSFRNQEAKYRITMLFDRKTDLKELKRAANNAIVEKWGADKSNWPKSLKSPFRDGNEKSDLEGYDGTIFVTATSKQPPGVIDQRKNDLLSDADFYAGCYARATLIAFAYGDPKEGIPYGVAFSLQNIQKLRDGKGFSGRRTAQEEFEEVEDGSDDAKNYGNTEEAQDGLGF